MFLENMTWQQIRSRVKANEDFVNRNFNRTHAEWLKTAKRIRPLPVCFHKTVKTHDKDEFLMIGTCHDGKKLGIIIFAVVPTAKGKEYVMLDEDMYSDMLRDKLTQHFIKRYRERGMDGKECSVEKVIATFFMYNENRIKVYQDPKDETSVVYTTKQGLAICHTDQKGGFLELATYIDDSMLFATQRIAKEKIMSKLHDGIDYDNTYYVESIMNELLPIVQDIYSKYKSGAADYLVFKKTNVEEEVNLNFKLKTSKQMLERNQVNKPQKTEKKGSIMLPSFAATDYKMLMSPFMPDMRNCKSEVQGNPNGKGRIIFKEKTKTLVEYKGELRDGKPNGKGVMKMMSSHTFEGTFVDGSPEGHIRHYLPDGSYEEGIFHGMKRNGMIHTHNERFDMWAMYNNDERIGDVRIETSAFKYEGEFKNNTTDGKGKLMFNDGRVYEGTFRNGCLKGKGKEILEDGSVIEATFKKGWADGLGTLTEPDGTVYTGNFTDGDLDGFVQRRKPDGTTDIVEFYYGENVEDWDEEWDDELDFEEFEDDPLENS